jgi:hypothetical protein
MMDAVVSYERAHLRHLRHPRIKRRAVQRMLT